MDEEIRNQVAFAVERAAKELEAEEAVAAAMRISDICSKNICPNCIFEEDGGCALIGEVPEAWHDMLTLKNGDSET